MGALKSIKKIFSTPYKAIENKFIPIVNSLNNYLDKLFPQDKWNWRKIAVFWTLLEAVVISALEIYIGYKYRFQCETIYNFVQINGTPEEKVKFSTIDPLIVYYVIFVVALYYQYYLMCDTITKASTFQLIAVAAFGFILAIYSVIQYTQGGNYAFFHDYKLTHPSNNNDDIERPENFEKTIIGLSFLFSFGLIIISLRLYKVFGWNVFKQLGADIDVKNRLKLYQVLMTFLKIDIFFFISFAIQFLAFTVVNIKDNNNIQIINLAVIGTVFVIPFIGIYATKKESYRLMTIFLLLLSVSIGYMSYSLVDVLIDKYGNINKNEQNNGNNNDNLTKDRYRNCQNSLSIACILTIIISLLTYILALINFKNLPKGLKKDKSIRAPNSQNSTLSTSYGTPKRWSIE